MSHIYFRLFANTTKVRSHGNSKSSINYEIERYKNFNTLTSAIPGKEKFVGNTIYFTIQIVKQNKNEKRVIKQFQLPTKIYIADKKGFCYQYLKLELKEKVNPTFNDKEFVNKSFYTIPYEDIAIVKDNKNLNIVSKNLFRKIPLITVANYNKWYDLYLYYESNIMAFYSESIRTINHSYNPKDVVEYAIKMGFKIGLGAYRAIVLMYCENKELYCDGSYILNNDELPNKTDLEKVIEFDYGDFMNTITDLYETSLKLKDPKFKYFI